MHLPGALYQYIQDLVGEVWMHRETVSGQLQSVCAVMTSLTAAIMSRLPPQPASPTVALSPSLSVIPVSPATHQVHSSSGVSCPATASQFTSMSVEDLNIVVKTESVDGQ